MTQTLYTPEEAAAVVGVTVRRLRQLADEGKLLPVGKYAPPMGRPAGVYLHADLLRYLEQHPVGKTRRNPRRTTK